MLMSIGLSQNNMSSRIIKDAPKTSQTTLIYGEGKESLFYRKSQYIMAFVVGSKDLTEHLIHTINITEWCKEK